VPGRDARPIAGPRPKRLKEAKRRLEEELWTEYGANVACEAHRAYYARLFEEAPEHPVPAEEAIRAARRHFARERLAV
jgi:hypothetical protein